MYPHVRPFTTSMKREMSNHSARVMIWRPSHKKIGEHNRHINIMKDFIVYYVPAWSAAITLPLTSLFKARAPVGVIDLAGTRNDDLRKIFSVRNITRGNCEVGASLRVLRLSRRGSTNVNLPVFLNASGAANSLPELPNADISHVVMKFPSTAQKARLLHDTIEGM